MLWCALWSILLSVAEFYCIRWQKGHYFMVWMSEGEKYHFKADASTVMHFKPLSTLYVSICKAREPQFLFILLFVH